MGVVVEGGTRLAVPGGAGGAFFNPRARGVRDAAVAACAAFAEGARGPLSLLDAMCGTGAAGVRAAAETGAFGRVELNDASPAARRLAAESARLNGLRGASVSGMEACAFLSARAAPGLRGSVTNLDPFGSPAPFLDCALRATERGGMLAATATDLQVLCGIHAAACSRRYGGAPIRRAEFGNEVALRLVLGCLDSVCGRLGLGFDPLYAQSDQHYYRVYARVRARRSAGARGWAFLCGECGARGVSGGRPGPRCACGGAAAAGGPLWAGPLFDAGFVGAMRRAAAGRFPALDRSLAKAEAEAGMGGAYYTLDWAASRARAAPPRLSRALEALAAAGHAASPTSLCHTGFRTDAGPREIAAALF